MGMTSLWTREEIAQKVEELGADSFTNLIRQAEEMEIQLTEDYIDPRQFIAWEPGVLGCCELVNVDRCTCHRFRTWGRCAHHALALEHMGLLPELTLAEQAEAA